MEENNQEKVQGETPVQNISTAEAPVKEGLVEDSGMGDTDPNVEQKEKPQRNQTVVAIVLVALLAVLGVLAYILVKRYF